MKTFWLWASPLLEMAGALVLTGILLAGLEWRQGIVKAAVAVLIVVVIIMAGDRFAVWRLRKGYPFSVVEPGIRRALLHAALMPAIGCLVAAALVDFWPRTAVIIGTSLAFADILVMGSFSRVPPEQHADYSTVLKAHLLRLHRLGVLLGCLLIGFATWLFVLACQVQPLFLVAAIWLGLRGSGMIFSSNPR